MFPLLLAFVQPNADLIQVHEPTPSYSICYEMEYDIYQAVEFGIITKNQANEILLRCVVNYSTGPNAPHVTDI